MDLNPLIFDFLVTGKLAGLEIGLSPESASRAIPGLSFVRATDGVRVFEADDLFVSFVDDRVFGFSIYVRGEEPKLPDAIGSVGFPLTRDAALRCLAQRDLSSSPHVDRLGAEIGIRLESGVVLLFDGEKVHSIRSPILESAE